MTGSHVAVFSLGGTISMTHRLRAGRAAWCRR